MRRALPRRPAALILPALLLLTAGACGLLGLQDEPDEVTRGFWGAIQAGDAEAARALASSASGRLVEATLDEVTIASVMVGEALRNEEAAVVSTTLVTLQEDRELDASFHTHLVREDGRWRVDLAASRAELRKGLFVAGMREIGQTLGEGVREMGEVFREGAREMEEALREALEEMQESPRL